MTQGLELWSLSSSVATIFSLQTASQSLFRFTAQSHQSLPSNPSSASSLRMWRDDFIIFFLLILIFAAPQQSRQPCLLHISFVNGGPTVISPSSIPSSLTNSTLLRINHGFVNPRLLMTLEDPNIKPIRSYFPNLDLPRISHETSKGKQIEQQVQTLVVIQRRRRVCEWIKNKRESNLIEDLRVVAQR